jgi:hypothetical protein
MPTKEQFDVFRFLFDQENEREKILIDRSKLYISLVTLYAGLLALAAKDAQPRNVWQWSIFAIAVASLVLAFLMALWAANVTDYEGVNDPEEMIENEFKDKQPSNQAFLSERIVDLAVASNRNSRVNDGKAKKLFIAGVFMLVGIAVHSLYFLIRIWP